MRRLTFKIARLEAELKQRELANMLGVSKSLVAHWETGRSTPDAKMRKKLALLLNKPSFELFA